MEENRETKKPYTIVTEPPEQAGGSPQVVPVEIRVGSLQRVTVALTLLYTAATLTLVFVVVQQLRTARHDLATARDELAALTRVQARDRIDRRFAEFYTPRMLYSRAKASEAFPEPGPHLLVVFQFFETLARDYRAGIVDTNDVWYHFSGPLLLYWSGWSDWVAAIRDKDKDPTVWAGYEHLVNAVIEKEDGARLPTQPEIQDQLGYEIALLALETEFRTSFEPCQP